MEHVRYFRAFSVGQIFIVYLSLVQEEATSESEENNALLKFASGQ